MSALRSLLSIRSPLMAFFAMGIFWGTWGALIPDVKAKVGADDGAFGFALLFVALGAVPAMVLGGRLLDRMGARLLPASVLLFAATVPLPGLAGAPTTLAFALFAIGLGSGLMDVAMNARLSAIEATTRSRSMHMAHGFFAVVYLAAALATGAARDAAVEPLRVLATASLVMVGLAILSGLFAEATDASGPAAAESKQPRRFDLPVVLLGLVVFAAFLSENGWQSWSALFLERVLGADPWLGSSGPAIVGVALAVGRFGAQIFAARVSDAAMIVWATSLAMTGGGVLALAPSASIALTALFVAATGVSVIAPAALSLAGRSAAPERRGAAVAAVGVIGYTGFFAGPALLGFVAETFGLRFALASIVAVLASIIPLIFLYLRRSPRAGSWRSADIA